MAKINADLLSTQKKQEIAKLCFSLLDILNKDLMDSCSPEEKCQLIDCNAHLRGTQRFVDSLYEREIKIENN